MERKRFTEEEIIGILKEPVGCVATLADGGW